MYDTFLAVIMMCAINAAPGTALENRCVFVQDREGPSATRVTCRKKMDAMWQRIMKNGKFISETHKKIGDFRLIQSKHRGFCLDPKLPLDGEIEKYYNQ